jgi:hypothetical protein
LPLPIVDQLPARHVRAAWLHRCAIGCVEHDPRPAHKISAAPRRMDQSNLLKKTSNIMSKPSICGQDGRIREGAAKTLEESWATQSQRGACHVQPERV